MELDNIAALENLKSAIVVLGRHQGAAFPQIPLSLIAVNGKQEPWAAGHESQLSHSFDEFLRHNSFSTDAKPAQGFLQDEAPVAATVGGWAAADVNTVRRALKSASAFMQAHGKYMPSYNSQSGEIFGVLKQLQDEMKADLSEAQKTEAARAATFEELRSAKTSEIESGEKMAEEKEDELATTDNDLAEAKEDLEQTKKQLAEDQAFMKNLKKMCSEGDANFEERKKARLAEIQAVSETIEILTGDEAKDAMDTTFSLIQTSSTDKLRRKAAALLRRTAT